MSTVLKGKKDPFPTVFFSVSVRMAYLLFVQFLFCCFFEFERIKRINNTTKNGTRIARGQIRGVINVN